MGFLAPSLIYVLEIRNIFVYNFTAHKLKYIIITIFFITNNIKYFEFLVLNFVVGPFFIFTLIVCKIM